MKLFRLLLFPLAAVAMASVFSGCATHPKRMACIRSSLASPSYTVNPRKKPFRESNVTGMDRILYLSERARAYQLTGDHEKSSADYRAAEAVYEERDEKPVVSLSSGAAKGAALLLNDLAIPYEGNAHERLMLYTLDAFNFLAKNDWNNARAVVNNIPFFSEKERERRDRLVAAAEEAAQSDRRFNMAALRSNAVFQQNFAAMDSTSRTFLDALQNGYAHYLCGFVHETDLDWTNADLCYRRAAEVAPNNAFVKRDIARVQSLAQKGATLPDPDAPNVVVFFEEGYAPELQSFSFSFTTLPVKHTGLNHPTVGVGNASVGGRNVVGAVPLPGMTPISLKLTFPYYSRESLNAFPSRPLVLSEGGRTIAETQLVGDFRALAARAFEERFPYIATRAAFRMIAKATAATVANEAARRRGNNYWRFVIWLGGLFLTHGTEHPDLRSWNLAPRYGQIARFHLPAGSHSLAFAHGGLTGNFAVTVPADGSLVLHVMSVPGRLVVEGTAIDFQ